MLLSGTALDRGLYAAQDGIGARFGEVIWGEAGRDDQEPPHR